MYDRILILLFMVTALVACGPSSAELSATATTAASATQLAVSAAATATQLAMPTATPAADPAIGEVLFNTRYLEASGRNCHYCHKTKTSDVTPLFSLVGFAAVAGDRIEGMSGEDYIRQAILDPSYEGHDVYEGFFSQEEMNHLIAFVLSLE